jgi:glycosyltransferase involved in cell wall biosynthesis
MARVWNKADIINRFAQLRGYRTYLEICTPTTGGHFAEIDRATFETCQRLMYRCPDDYDDGLSIDFRSPKDDISDCVRRIMKKKLRYDVILMDGHHEYETAYRDVKAAFELLAPAGVVLVHDCLPATREQANPTFIEGTWMGVAYKAFLDFVVERTDLLYCTIDCDYGCGIIRKNARWKGLRSVVRRIFSASGIGRSAVPASANEITSVLIQKWRSTGNDFSSAFDLVQEHKRQLMKLTSVEGFSGVLLDWPEWVRLDSGVTDEVRGLTVMADVVSQDTSDLTIAAIIPLFNGARYIEGAIKSVLGQSFPATEIIVVDDGSVDGGPAIVERLARENPIKFLRTANSGQASARNLGAAHSSSAFLAFLDQDDFWYSNHLKTLVEPFQDQHAVPIGWVYSDVDEVDKSGAMICRKFLRTMGTEHPKRSLHSCLGDDMFILPSASLISRAAFERAGGFDERLSGYEDDDLFLKLFRLGFANVFIEEPLSQWRIHVTSSSYSPRMGRSRMIYARKLYAQFPDNQIRRQYPSRDLIAPRIARSVLAEYELAVRRRDKRYFPQIASDLRETARHMGFRCRWMFLLAIPLMRFAVFGGLLLAFIDFRRFYRNR